MTTTFRLLCAALALAACAGGACAQSALDKHLNRSLGEDAAKNEQKVEGVNKVHATAAGYWRLDGQGGKSAEPCAITYVRQWYSAGYVAPQPGSDESFFVLSGPSIPPVDSPTRKKMKLFARGSDVQEVQAMHIPNRKEAGAIVFKLTDLKEALNGMSDVENLRIGLDNKDVFSMSWDGGHKAREAMRKCLGEPVPKEATPSMAAGRSTIEGRAYTKVALLAPKQYPPKGHTVTLIRMTDEFKQWWALASESMKRGERPQVPQQIKDLASIARIEDDEGRFRFNNLPPGEYVLRVSFDYQRSQRVNEYMGSTVTTVNNHVVGVQDHVLSYSRNVLGGAEIEKNITIQNDGDTVKVDLEKSSVLRRD